MSRPDGRGAGKSNFGRDVGAGTKLAPVYVAVRLVPGGITPR